MVNLTLFDAVIVLLEMPPVMIYPVAAMLPLVPVMTSGMTIVCPAKR